MVVMGTVKDDKQVARRVVQTHMHTMACGDHSLLADIVYNHVRQRLSELHEAGKLRNILSYHAVPQWGEVDLSPLEREFKDVRFNYVPANPQAPFPTTTYDAVLVPLYGFNSEGYRLGRGSGWYDRFLATQPQAVKVGVGFEISRVHFIADPYDIPMDIVITETGQSNITQAYLPLQTSLS